MDRLVRVLMLLVFQLLDWEVEPFLPVVRFPTLCLCLDEVCWCDLGVVVVVFFVVFLTSDENFRMCVSLRQCLPIVR